jgi:hypothetical protein
MNGGFTTTVSGQTVTLTRNGSGTAEPVGAQTCTIANISNPSTTGSTGTYTIQITDAVDTVLDQDTLVAADTITGAGTLTGTNIQPENQVAQTLSQYTLTFTSVNTLTAGGRIAATFPSGYDISAASSPTCSSMDGGFSLSTSSQTVTILRDGTGTNQAAAAESCSIRGIRSPVSGTTTSYALATQDALGNPTDAATVLGDPYFTAPSLTSTNVQPATLISGSSSIATVSFTTVTSTPIGAKIRVTFPGGFSTSNITAAACATIAGTETFTTTTNAVTITTVATASEAPGAESCTVSLITNPAVSGSTGTYAIEVLDESPSGNTVSSDMSVAADTITAATLLSTDVIPENLVGSSTQMHIVQFTTVNPIPPDGKIYVTYPSGFSVASTTAASCTGFDGSVSVATSGTAQVILTRSGGTTSTAGAATECTLSNVRNRSTAGSSGAYNVTTTNAGDAAIDWSAVAADTYVVPAALSTTNVQPTSLVQLVTSDTDIQYTTAQNIPTNGSLRITFGAGFDLSNVTGGSCVGFDGSLSMATSGQTVILTRSGGTTVGTGAKTCRILGARNPSATGSTGAYAIELRDASGFTHALAASVTADTITAPGTLTSADIQPSSLVTGATTTGIASFGFTNGWPHDAKLAIALPSGFQTAPASASCSGFTGGVSVSASGTNTFVIARDGSSTGTASGVASCSFSQIKNPIASGSTGSYGVVLYDRNDVTIASGSASADTLSAADISSANIEMETLLAGATSTANIAFTTTNVIPANGKIAVIFPAGFSLGGVSSSSVTCNNLSGSFLASVAGQTVTAARSGGATSTESFTANCSIANVRAPLTAGSAGSYTIRTLTSADTIIDQNASVATDTFSTTGTLTSADISPASFSTNGTSVHTIELSHTLGIPSDGLIRITYPSGFNLTAANSPTCSTMDGSFSLAVAGNVATITRSGGTAQAAASETCRISGIQNPSSAGSGGTYQVQILLANGSLIEEDPAVPADQFSVPLTGGGAVGGSSGGSGGGGGGGGGTFSPLTQTISEPATEAIAVRLRNLPIEVHRLIKLADDQNPKTQEDSAVYYVGADGLRHAFPNSNVFFSWYCGFDGVTVVPSSVLSSIGLGTNITYRPGTRMVKFTTDPKTYLVTKGGILRHISGEDVARRLYGEGWQKKIDDISDAFYANYQFGPDLKAADTSPDTLLQSVTHPSDSLRIAGYSGATGPTAPATCARPEPQPAAAPRFPRPSSIPTGFAFTATLKKDSAPSTEIRHLQSILAALGQSIYPEQRVTGIFGPATEVAVKRYQASQNIPETGTVDTATRAKLNTLIRP